MKKLLMLCMVFIVCSRGYAQNYNQYGNNYGYYYSPILYPNGFRTVEEENRLMEQSIAERRRQRRIDSMSAEQIAEANKRNEIKREIRRDAIQSQKGKEQASAKKPAR